MSTLEKFDGTLDELGAEVGKLKSVSAAYQKIEGLATANAEVNRKFDQARQDLGKINDAHLANKAAIEKSLSDLAATNAEGKKELTKLIDERIDVLRKENKDFYKELEATIKIKLEDNKSEIKRLIENERLQMKEIITNELATRTREIREAMEAETGKQTVLLVAAQGQTRMAVWIMGGISAVLGLGILLKVIFG
jgi:hypothetical protein